LDTGALAFIDCLGFKGIWQRADADVVLKAFDVAEEKSRKAMEASAALSGVRTQMVALSDTIVVGAVAIDPASAASRGAAVMGAALNANYVAKELMDIAPAIAVRGCICFGAFSLTPKRIIGPAVDEAAELHEIANGAFTWVHPALDADLDAFLQQVRNYALLAKPADMLEQFKYLLSWFPPARPLTADETLTVLKEVHPFLMRTVFENEMVRYRLPLKGGERLDCHVLNPLSWRSGAEERIKRYMLAMASPAIDVVVKRQHTVDFLQHVVRRTAQHEEEWRKLNTGLRTRMGAYDHEEVAPTDAPTQAHRG
jgi:hypothetical protein